MIHLQRELLKRRDKRLELATRKRAFELENVTKRRRTDEDATWTWWKVRAVLFGYFMMIYTVLQLSRVSFVLIAGGRQGDVARSSTTLHLTWTPREENKWAGLLS